MPKFGFKVPNCEKLSIYATGHSFLNKDLLERPAYFKINSPILLLNIMKPVGFSRLLTNFCIMYTKNFAL